MCPSHFSRGDLSLSPSWLGLSLSVCLYLSVANFGRILINSCLMKNTFTNECRPGQSFTCFTCSAFPQRFQWSHSTHSLSLYLSLGHPLCQLFTAISIFLHNFYRVHTLNANFQSGRTRLTQGRLRFRLGHGTTIVAARPLVRVQLSVKCPTLKRRPASPLARTPLLQLHLSASHVTPTD